MGILWEDEAWREYIGWQTEDKKTLKKDKQAYPGHSEEPI